MDFERKLEVHHSVTCSAACACEVIFAMDYRARDEYRVSGLVDQWISWIVDQEPVLQSRNQFGNPFFEDRHALFKPVIGERITPRTGERGG
jgi:hypothetical protein